MPVETGEPETVELEARLKRYPPGQYPVQHATAAFHLGAVHLQRDRVPQALAALDLAREVFTRVGMPVERAKALMMSGLALRAAGDHAHALRALDQAIEQFAGLERPTEEAAANYNLGLVLRDGENAGAACAAFARAHELFKGSGQLAQAGAAAREQGTCLLAQGKLDAARPLLETAVEYALKSGDAPGMGGAANALGLLHLAQDDPAAAETCFLNAIGAHPRSLRPAEYAMGKANLAVARERAGDICGARLAALQAMGTPTADHPVTQQAQLLLDRVGAPTGDELSTVLAAEPLERWQLILRDEVLRWVDAVPADRSSAVRGWVHGQITSQGRSHDLAESLLGILLELPPTAYKQIISAVVRAVSELDEADADRFRAGTRSGMARFPVPQWQRMAAGFEQAATGMGGPPGWS